MFGYLPLMFLGLIPVIVVIFIIVGIVAFFNNHNRNTNNMDPNQIKPKVSAGNFLLNIGAIIVLYTIVSNLISLIFTVIEKAYPKITNGYNYLGSQSISWPVSILIILFPIFVTIMYFLEKEYTQNPEKRNIGIHKWLTYTTLFIGGSILIGDLITVIYFFIDGQELDMGFLLKVFSILTITLVVFLYYIADARNTLTPLKRKVWLVISIVIVLISIVWGFSVLGSPRTQKLLKYDELKISNLQSMTYGINNYFSSKGILPNTLEEISGGNYYVPLMDSQTNKPYEYKRTGNLTYEVCADFNSASNNKDSSSNLPYMYDRNVTSWVHPSGYYCFAQTINPNTYSKPVPSY